MMIHITIERKSTQRSEETKVPSLYSMEHISTLPFEYRTRNEIAYFDAILAACDKSLPSYVRYAEKKVVKQLLLSDIARLRAEHRTDDANTFARMYTEYFGSPIRSLLLQLQSD